MCFIAGDLPFGDFVGFEFGGLTGDVKFEQVGLLVDNVVESEALAQILIVLAKTFIDGSDKFPAGGFVE